MAKRASHKGFPSKGMVAASSGRAGAVAADRQLSLTLAEATARYRAIFEQSADPILVVGSDGYLLDFNAAAYKSLGYTREEFSKLHLCRIDALESAEKVAKRIKAVLAEGASHFETKHRTKAGEIRDVVVNTTVVHVDGKSLFVSTLHDVTEERESRLVLERKNAALLEVLDQARQAKAEVGQQIRANLDKVIVPMLHQLGRELPPDQQPRLAVLDKALKEIASPFASKLTTDVDSLTAVEIRLCRLIREGMPTKDIAQMQHVSPATVAKHREHIRRKLGLRGKSVNLASYLDKLLDDHSSP